MAQEDRNTFYRVDVDPVSKTFRSICFAHPHWRAWYTKYGSVLAFDPKGPSVFKHNNVIVAMFVTASPRSK